MNNRSLSLIAGVIVGFIGCYLIFYAENQPEIITVTETRTDTVFVQIRDTVHVTRTEIKHEHLRDTVYVPELGQISLFTASKPFLYGNTYVKGEVLGEVLKMDITNDFKIPTVTNTIETTNTVIKKPSGLFVTVGANQRTPYVGGVFVKDRFLVGLNTGGFQVGYRVK